jgi:hypothetical protein
VTIYQLIAILEKEVIEHTNGSFNTSWQIERLKLAAERKTEPQWVRELIKKYDKKADT